MIAIKVFRSPILGYNIFVSIGNFVFRMEAMQDKSHVVN